MARKYVRHTPKLSAEQIRQYRRLHDKLKELAYTVVSQHKSANLSKYICIEICEDEE